MENILFATDAVCIDCNALEFACTLAGASGSPLRGVFLERKGIPLQDPGTVICGDILGEPDVTGFEADTEKTANNMDRFKRYCAKKHISCTTWSTSGDPLEAVLLESRFADFMVIGAGTSCNAGECGYPAPFLKMLLQKAACPLVIVPEKVREIEEVVFAYDGSASAVFAIRQFAHLLPSFEDKRMLVVQVGGQPEVQFKQQIGELLKRHYSQVGYEVLDGTDPSYELFLFLRERNKSFVVMGAYGRSYLSQLFEDSTASPLLQLLKLPVFIAHY